MYYSIELGGLKSEGYSTIVEVYDRRDHLVGQAKGLTGEIRVSNPNLWWPRGMNQSVGYLYTLKVDKYVTLSTNHEKFKCDPSAYPKGSVMERRQKCGG